MDNDILFVTAFKDIGREQWSSIQRTNNEYFYKFFLITQTIQHNLVVFIEDNIKKQLLEKYIFLDNVLFFDMNNVDTFYKQFLHSQTKIINSLDYKSKIPIDRKGAPEHNYAEYNLINHSKINFIREAKFLFPNYSFYSWIDFGFGKSIDHLPTKISNINSLPRKIIYHNEFDIPETKITPNDMLKEHRIFFIGSSLIIPNELIENFENLWKSKIIELENINVVDDDQNIVYQLYFDNKDMFELIRGKHWFAFYEILSLYW